jgi:hypothetical protein
MLMLENPDANPDADASATAVTVTEAVEAVEAMEAVEAERTKRSWSWSRPDGEKRINRQRWIGGLWML